MTLTPGERLGPFEITGALGAGGMGEVYRARDTKLNRDVAIKVLPRAFADDPERLARFTREAQTLASLNHPNIASIYGIEEFKAESGGGPASRALVMELVSGEDLSAHIARGPMSIAEALPIARQIAEALEAAHELGIVHRDLKPANIKVRVDGTVKVLDFGLAKAKDPSGTSSSSPDVSHSPTLTHQGTSAGMIIGTAAYMSPEQAKGKSVDKRADIWAFGVVLYEMLSGQRAFKGDDVSETLASVLKDTLPLDTLPADIPPPLKRLISRCLDRDLKTRLRDIGEARVKLSRIETGETASVSAPGGRPSAPASPWAWAWKLATALLLLVALVSTGAWQRERSKAPAAARFFVAAPDNTTFVANQRPATIPAISPDGRSLAFVARDASGSRRLWVRPVDSLVAEPLEGTEGAAWPFWSPDSRTIAYSVAGKLMRVAATGGPSSTICALGPGISARGGAWNRDGVLVFNNGPATLHRVSQSGGTATPMGQLSAGETGRQFPSFLPDGRHLLYHGSAGVYVTSLDGNESKLIVPSDTGGIYDSQNRHLLFGRKGTLMAQAFDPKTFALTGDAFPVAERVESAVVPGVVAFSVSDMGALVYGIGAAPGAGYQLVWLDRQGKILGTVGPPGNYRGLDLSPDGSRVAAHRHDDQGGDIWITDVSPGTTTRFTLDASQHNASPVWSPDGRRVAFSSVRSGRPGVYMRNANGTGDDTLMYETEATVGAIGPQPHGFSADGRSLLLGVQTGKATRRDLWLLPTSAQGKAAPLVETALWETHGQLSPDGKWLAYTSRGVGIETGEIVVQPAAAMGGKWAVSSNGGHLPRWRGDSEELFFYTQSGRMMAVAVTSKGSGFASGTPVVLFDHGYRDEPHADYFPYAVTRDGQRFLMSRPVESVASVRGESPIVVALNWMAGIGR